MDAAKVVKELSEQYPGKNIVKLPEDDPKEIICETEPTSEHSEYSVAVAVIDESAPHFNKETEIYHILRGRLVLQVADGQVELIEGDKYTIIPNTVHSAKGDETWIEVRTEPGWTPEGHTLV